MRLVNLTDITIKEGRQRKEFTSAKLKELEESILSVGLLHPIVVRHVESPDGNEDFIFLVAGERRLRTIQKMAEEKMIFFCNGEEVPVGKVPVTLTAELSEIELKEAELDENIKRVDLTWQERVSAMNELLALRRSQNPETTKTEVAREIASATDKDTDTVRVELQRAELIGKMASDPRVSGARTAKEAYNIASKLIEAEFHQQLAAAVGEVSSEHQIFHGDCVSVMSSLTPGTIDVILSDPPYGMGADSFGDAGPAHAYKDDPESAMKVAQQIILHGLVLCKEQAHLYLFCDIDQFHALRDFAEKAGWTTWRTPLVWDKGGAHGHNPVPEQAIRRSYETILYCYRGNRPAVVFLSDVLRDIPPVTGSVHAAEKPVELYRRLLSRSVRPGDLVLDPCCGSGPIFEAANALHVKAIGIDRDEGFVNYARGRMQRGFMAGGEGQPSTTEGATVDVQDL